MALLLALTAALSLFVAPLQPRPWAELGPEPTTNDREAAKQAFDRGLAAVASGEFEAAVAAFEQAHHLRPHPVTLFNLALALEKAERLPEAWALFDEVVDIVESDAERREVRRHMRTIANEIAILEIQAGPAARSCLDGIALLETATGTRRLAVEPGRHRLLLDEQDVELELGAGEWRVLLVDDTEALTAGRRRGPLMPTMLGLTIGGGALALGLGVGAALSETPATRTGLAVGAASGAGLALVAGVTALAIEAREPSTRRRGRSEQPACPGNPALDQRLDLKLAPTLAQPREFSSLPMPVPASAQASLVAPAEPAVAHPRSIVPPRATAQKRPTTTTPM